MNEFSSEMLELIAHVERWREQSWQVMIYNNFSSNDRNDYEDIYADFIGLTKIEWCSKWSDAFVGSEKTQAVEMYYELIKSEYILWRKSLEYLRMVDVDLVLIRAKRA
jgi:hypothetical protein